MNRSELGAFLIARRAELGPDDVGLPNTRRRRVKGLRREEVAARAGLSIEYYVRLEQGKARNPSPEVLRAIAGALRMTTAQTRYLAGLVGPSRQPGPHLTVRAELRLMLRSMPEVAAVVYNHRFDILCWNELFSALTFDIAEAPERDRNIARFDFLDPTSRERVANWDDVCRATAGQLRLAAAQHPGDEELAELIGDLTASSSVFRKHWDAGDVDLRTSGAKTFCHPAVGEINLAFDTFELPHEHNSDLGQVGQRLLILHPTADDARDALRLIGAWRTSTVSDSATHGPSERDY